MVGLVERRERPEARIKVDSAKSLVMDRVCIESVWGGKGGSEGEGEGTKVGPGEGSKQRWKVSGKQWKVKQQQAKRCVIQYRLGALVDQ